MSVVHFMVLLMIRVWTGVAILRTLSLPTILAPNRNISTSVKTQSSATNHRYQCQPLPTMNHAMNQLI